MYFTYVCLNFVCASFSQHWTDIDGRASVKPTVSGADVTVCHIQQCGGSWNKAFDTLHQKKHFRTVPLLHDAYPQTQYVCIIYSLQNCSTYLVNSGDSESGLE